MTFTELFSAPLPASDLFWTLVVLGTTGVVILILYMVLPADSHVTAPLERLREKLGVPGLNAGLFLIAMLMWTAIFLTLFVGLFGMIVELWFTGYPGTLADNPEVWRVWRFSLAKITALTAVLGAVVAFPVTLTRLTLTRRQTLASEDALFNDKINEAAASLYATRVITKEVEDPQAGLILRDMHEDDIVRRNAAIDALEGLARERPAEALRISRMLSVYVRELSREHPGEPVPEGLEPDDLWGWARGLRPKRSDMYSAVLTLGRMRKTHETAFTEERIDLRGANLQGMGLSADNLSFEKVLFAQADMQGANLTGAKLQGANLFEAKLQGANLTEAELQGANLSGAKLQGASLSRAEFDAATNLTATLLRFVAVRFVDFTNVALSQEQIDSMFGDQTVTRPDGITRPAHWPEIDEDNWGKFDDAWHAWQAKHGFDPEDPATWDVDPTE